VGTGMFIILVIAERTIFSTKEERIKRKQKTAYRNAQRRK
jgi:hypothetical protein